MLAHKNASTLYLLLASRGTAGGGISSIKEIVTHTYEVSISQEERIDVLTYELAIDDDCTVTLIKKSEATVSFGQ